MSDGQPDPILLRCEADGYPNPGDSRPATVSLRVRGAGEDHVRLEVGLAVDETAVGAPCVVYGFDLAAFADELAALHASLGGSARLLDWDGEVILVLTALDRRRGRIAVGGRVRPAVFYTEVASEERIVPGPFAGIVTSFEGLITDQSHLPDFLGAIRRLLCDTRVSTVHPMGR